MLMLFRRRHAARRKGYCCSHSNKRVRARRPPQRNAPGLHAFLKLKAFEQSTADVDLAVLNKTVSRRVYSLFSVYVVETATRPRRNGPSLEPFLHRAQQQGRQATRSSYLLYIVSGACLALRCGSGDVDVILDKGSNDVRFYSAVVAMGGLQLQLVLAHV